MEYLFKHSYMSIVTIQRILIEGRGEKWKEYEALHVNMYNQLDIRRVHRVQSIIHYVQVFP